MDAYDAVVLSMHRDGDTDQQIADKLNVSREEIAAIIDASRTRTTFEPSDDDQPEQPVPAVRLTVKQLLTFGDAHADPAIRQHAAQARTSLDVLRDRHEVDAELHQITAEKSVLQERLAALEARESELLPAPLAKTKRDYDPREVRTWARRNGFTVPDRGQIPKDVMNAWRQQNQPRPLQAVPAAG